MEFILQLVQDNPYFNVVAAVVALASAVTAVTPTPKSGGKIAKIYALVDLLAINIGKAKQKGDEEK